MKRTDLKIEIPKLYKRPTITIKKLNISKWYNVNKVKK